MNTAAFTMGFLLVTTALRFVIVIPLFLRARKTGLVNLYWLTAQFLALVIGIPFAAIGTVPNHWIFWIAISVAISTLIMFVHTTFYQGRKSPVLLFMGLNLLGMLAGIYALSQGDRHLAAVVIYPNSILAWIWHYWAARQAFVTIVQDSATQDWVKSRYRLMLAYSMLNIVSSIIGTLSTSGVDLPLAAALITVLLNIIGVVIQILVWVMPGWFYRWLNRNYRAPATEEELSEEELMRQLQQV